MNVINRINKLVSSLLGIFILAFMMFAFKRNIITECEIILCYVLIITCYCVIEIKCHSLIKLGFILLTTLLIHVEFINVCVDMKYLYDSIEYTNEPPMLYLLYGLSYVYCLLQQWILFSNHSIAQLKSSTHLKSILCSIGCFCVLVMAISFPYLSSHVVIYVFPIIHYSAILITSVFLFVKTLVDTSESLY